MNLPPLFLRFFPALRWFPYSKEALRSDFLAGLTVALVLIPQSMAYAQLAGMPAYYGLYAAFLPVIVAALWGSSNFLATGPVAVVALLTASSLSVFATPGTSEFISLAIALAFLVGVIQLLLGIFRLGVIVNFLSHPVLVGFTNAAAIIIGLSQLNKIFGLSVSRSDSFLNDIWVMLQQIGNTHWPTFLMGASAILLLWAFRRFAPKWPGVLIVVGLTTIVSWAIGFEQQQTVTLTQIQDSEYRQQFEAHLETRKRLREVQQEIDAKRNALKGVTEGTREEVALRFELELLEQERQRLNEQSRSQLKTLRAVTFEGVAGADGQFHFYRSGHLPANTTGDGESWRLVRLVEGNQLLLSSGGEVVGKIPEGLPEFKLPDLSWDLIRSLLTTAFVIALVAFMEAISIAKALAVKAKQRVDPNQELIGQGLANLVAGVNQACPVSGSFSRSAVNFNAGARTNLSSVFSALFVMITLLFLTPLLYHLPQAVLAAVIIMAVAGLVNFKAIRHAWQTSRHDGIAAIVTFGATLFFAPHLDQGILVGAGLAIGLYLYRTMRPRVAILGRHPDGSLRDAKTFNLPESEVVVAVRFDGPLYFANVGHFEDAIEEVLSTHPKVKYLVIAGEGINEVDATGEEVLRQTFDQLRSAGVILLLGGLKKPVRDVLEKAHLDELIGRENLFATTEQAIAAAYERAKAAGIEVQGRLLAPAT